LTKENNVIREFRKAFLIEKKKKREGEKAEGGGGGWRGGWRGSG